MTTTTAREFNICRPDAPDETPTWGQRSSSNQKACRKLAMKIRNRSNKIWVIVFNIRRGYQRTRWTYPCFFSSADDAYRYLDCGITQWPSGAYSATVEHHQIKGNNKEHFPLGPDSS